MGTWRCALAVLALFFTARTPALLATETLISLNPAEQSFESSLGPVTMVVDPDWEPYEHVDAQGNYTGIGADLIRLIARRAGLELQLVSSKDWDESIMLSRQGHAHIIPFLNQTPEREEWLVFTQPYFTNPSVIVTRSEHDYVADLASLDGERIVLPAGTSIGERVSRDYPNLSLIVVKDEAEAFRMVERGEADLTLRSLTMAAWIIRKEGWFNLKIAGEVPAYANHLRVGVRKDLTALRDILDRSIATISPLEVQEVVNRHIAIEVKHRVDYTLVLLVGLSSCLLLLLGWLWIRQLRTLNQRLADETARANHNAREADAATKAKSAFLAAMSHEIRTPLSAVLGYIDLLSASRLDPLQSEYIQNIASAGKTLLGVINNILDFSKIEAGMLELAPQACDPALLCRECLNTVRHAAAAKNLELNLELAPDLPASVLIDPLRFRQIVLNLLSNAIKFTKVGGVRLLASYEHPDSRLEIRVRDTGIGMDTAALARLFRPFSQAQARTSHDYGGTGLGLAITRMLVEKMGGQIKVESEPGLGSEFAFACLAPPAESPTPSPASQAPATSEHALRIILAEDTPMNRLMARRMIETIAPRSTVLEAEDGLKAVELWQSQGADLILMDMQMPGLDGLEATRRIRDLEQARGGHVPIVALTAGATTDDAALCKAAGMDAYLTKPVDIHALAQVLLHPGEIVQ